VRTGETIATSRILTSSWTASARLISARGTVKI